MNRPVIIRIPAKSDIRQKVRLLYTVLYQQWKKENPNSNSYTIKQLKQNIKNALSIHGNVVREESFDLSRYNKWENGIVICYSHCYWLVNFAQDRKGNLIANIRDVVYEGDYHNDIMDTKPYGESTIKSNLKLFIEDNNAINKFRNMRNKKVARLTEGQLHNIIAESVSQILMELDPRTYASAANAVVGKPGGIDLERWSKFHDAAVDAWNREYGYDRSNGKFFPRTGFKMDPEDQVPETTWYDKETGREGLIQRFDPYSANFEKQLKDLKSRKKYPVDKKFIKALEVASQMARGNGEYIPGKGWK